MNTKPNFLLIFICISGFCLANAHAADSPSPDVVDFLNDLGTKAAEAGKRNESVIAGSHGWLFFTGEFRALSIGPFWGANAAKTSRANNRSYVDPLPAIVDFHRQLKQAGIRLILAPIPAKAAVYPELASAKMEGKVSATEFPRIDVHHARFYQILREQGIDVLDLLPLFVKHRHDENGLMFCKTDTHWSGQGARLAAQAIAARIKTDDWYQATPKKMFSRVDREKTVTGDMARMVNESSPVTENLPLVYVGRKTSSGLEPVEPKRDSPLLLIGDSHTLVFHDPALHSRGAGLPDHLALELGMAVDLIGVRGSGATTTRISLLRRRDNLAGKKAVVWCLSFREFTESFDGWRKVPVIR